MDAQIHFGRGPGRGSADWFESSAAAGGEKEELLLSSMHLLSATNQHPIYHLPPTTPTTYHPTYHLSPTYNLQRPEQFIDQKPALAGLSLRSGVRMLGVRVTIYHLLKHFLPPTSLTNEPNNQVKPMKHYT